MCGQVYLTHATPANQIDNLIDTTDDGVRSQTNEGTGGLIYFGRGLDKNSAGAGLL
jgi:hypothetical protein